ncbi:MAG: hypothetical protein Q9170_003549 [Blastenia crenularia]
MFQADSSALSRLGLSLKERQQRDEIYALEDEFEAYKSKSIEDLEAKAQEIRSLKDKIQLQADRIKSQEATIINMRKLKRGLQQELDQARFDNRRHEDASSKVDAKVEKLDADSPAHRRKRFKTEQTQHADSFGLLMLADRLADHLANHLARQELQGPISSDAKMTLVLYKAKRRAAEAEKKTAKEQAAEGEAEGASD